MAHSAQGDPRRSWRLRRRAHHREAVLTALLRDLTERDVDHVVVTGDLTNLGLPAELAEARRWLTRVGPPARLTVVPGNHDAYAASSTRVMIDAWKTYLTSDEPWPTLDGDPFPAVRIRGPVAFIGLSSARPSPAFLATGTLGARRLEQLGDALRDTGRRGLFRVVLLHHPVLPGTVRWRKRLTDASALRAVLARHGAELVLHGHSHPTSVQLLDAAPRPIPIVGVPSASAETADVERGGRYHVYAVTRRATGWEAALTVRISSASLARFVSDGTPRALLDAPDHCVRRNSHSARARTAPTGASAVTAGFTLRSRPTRLTTWSPR
jgi:3',5'-cyclic AMP phosphodiesterase CpdA